MSCHSRTVLVLWDCPCIKSSSRSPLLTYTKVIVRPRPSRRGNNGTICRSPPRAIADNIHRTDWAPLPLLPPSSRQRYYRAQLKSDPTVNLLPSIEGGQETSSNSRFACHSNERISILHSRPEQITGVLRVSQSMDVKSTSLLRTTV